jgi:hypothetical protein
MKDAAALIQAIAWPLIALIALFILRKALPGMVEGLGRRVTKLSIFKVSIDLAIIPEMETTWRAPDLGDVRQPTRADLFDAPAIELLTQFHDERAFDYAVVDLGEGREWLSSRLFVFAEMLPRLRGLRCFVFLETAGTIRRRLVGIARPEAVRWALAREYLWLELALEQAYASLGPQYLHPKAYQFIGEPDPISPTGALPPGIAQQIGRTFLETIQETRAAPSSTSPDNDGWVPVPNVPVPNANVQEHAEWLDGRAIEAVLGAALLQDSWVTHDPLVPDEQQVTAVLRRQGDLVAMVRGDRTFSGLVDRRLLLEELAARQLRQ